MKLIVAVVQPQQLPAVKEALAAAQVKHLTCTNILGTTHEAEHQVYRGVEHEVTLFQKVRIEIAVNEAFVEPTIEAITLGGRASGGFGKIFVSDLHECVTIKTGERGPRAIG